MTAAAPVTPAVQDRPSFVAALGDRYDPNFGLAAVCSSTDPELFFPNTGDTSTDAKKLCRGDARCLWCSHPHAGQDCTHLRGRANPRPCRCEAGEYEARSDPCPGLVSCLAWALDHSEVGVWGGLSERERRALRHTTRSGGPISAAVALTVAGDTVPLTDREKAEAAFLLLTQRTPNRAHIDTLGLDPETLAALEQKVRGMAA